MIARVAFWLRARLVPPISREWHWHLGAMRRRLPDGQIERRAPNERELAEEADEYDRRQY